MKNILDVTVSRFESCTTPDRPRDVNLLEWLQSDEFRSDIEALRSIDTKSERDAAKRKLPGVTVSGTFSHRNKEGLLQHSGLICLDIDGKENRAVEDYEELKREIATYRNVAYCGLSASGQGLFCIIPITYPEKHEQHFNALRNVFAVRGIIIDRNCRDVCRLRGCSWDANPYINPTAIPFSQVYTPPPPKPPQRSYILDGDTANDVRRLVDEIAMLGMDITGAYEQWRNIGFALADEFGESGRGLFHEVSRNATTYNSRECDQQYTSCLQSRGGGVTIATFYKLCKDYGIFLKSRP